MELITRDMRISDILEKNPAKAMRLSDIMTNFGLHCVGCGASTFETLEQGVLGHGFTEDKLVQLITELNVIVDTPEFVEKEGDGSILSVTEVAHAKVKEIMTEEGKPNSGLRIAVIPGGCAGFTYDMAFQDEPSEGDILVDQNGLKIFIDNASAEHLKGTVINYVSSLQGSGFTFENPTAAGGCGCGKSFN